MKKTKILFVCLGNICRSPAAEAIMKKILAKENLDHVVEVDSAGILSYHRGELPDERMRKYGAMRGYEVNSISRPVTEEDFTYFDMLIGMDDQNIADLKVRAPSQEATRKIVKINRFFNTYANHTFVPDPYYGGKKEFDLAIDLLEDACEGLLKELKRK